MENLGWQGSAKSVMNFIFNNWVIIVARLHTLFCGKTVVHVVSLPLINTESTKLLDYLFDNF